MLTKDDIDEIGLESSEYEKTEVEKCEEILREIWGTSGVSVSRGKSDNRSESNKEIHET